MRSSSDRISLEIDTFRQVPGRPLSLPGPLRLIRTDAIDLDPCRSLETHSPCAALPVPEPAITEGTTF
jgi:hypothetical protein